MQMIFPHNKTYDEAGIVVLLTTLDAKIFITHFLYYNQRVLQSQDKLYSKFTQYVVRLQEPWNR